MASEITLPEVEKELAGVKLSPAKRAAIIAAATGGAVSRLAEQSREIRQKVLARTKRSREYFSKPVPRSIAAAIGAGIAEPVRRDVVGRFTDNVYMQALSIAAIGAGAQVLEEAVGVPGIGQLGVGMIGVGAWMGTVKLMYDSKDKPDPVAYALSVTTRKARKDREKKKEAEEKKDEKKE
jgi:DNA-binding transcriptional regulator YdaS (Cro superfamily)